VMLLVTALVLGNPACNENSPPPAKAGKDAEHKHHAGDDHDHAHGDGDTHEHENEVSLTAEAVTRYGVKVETAALHVLQLTFIAPARVAYNAEAMAHVGTPLPGRVVELNAKLGDAVKKGDVLLTVESPELGEAQSDFLVKQITARTAVSAVELASSALERAK